MNKNVQLQRLPDLHHRTVRWPQVFDEISCLAAKALGCPTALVTMFDEATHWSVGRAGTDLVATPRNLSFCSICVASDAPLLITDASREPRYANNPLVTHSPFIRSYLGIPLRTADGVLIGALCTISGEPDAFCADDVTTLQSYAVLAEAAVRAHDHDLRQSLASASMIDADQAFEQPEPTAQVGSWRLDIARNQIRFSDRVFAMLNLPAIPQISLTGAVAFCEPADRPILRKALADAQNQGCAFELELGVVCPDGSNRRLRVMGQPVRSDRLGLRIVGIVTDITHEDAARPGLEHTAAHDQLTGLLNRTGFNQRLREAARTCDGAVQTVMLIDLDKFRDTNDAHGHLAGDQLLVQIAERMVQKAGQDTTIARWGGDEFAVLFPAGTLLNQASCTGMMLLDAIAEDMTVGDGRVSLSATCGLAQLDGPCSGEDLVRRADLALSLGKDNGGGCLQAWSEDLDGASSQRQRAMTRLKQALSEGRVFAAYQPIVEIETGTIVGVEALLRIDEGSGEPVTASDVLSAITDPQISRKVSRTMLEHVLRDGPELLAQIGPNCQIGINVSEADLRQRDGDEDFVTLITRLMHTGALQPGNITVEVTETMSLRDQSGRVRDGLRALDRLGYHIALDDFGTGFSSLTHLRHFPIRKVKIDKEFVAGIAGDQQARMIIQAIVQMSRSLGLDVVAEGVENATEEMFLRAIGCRYAQGYRYGKAVRPGNFAALSAKRFAG